MVEERPGWDSWSRAAKPLRLRIPLRWVVYTLPQSAEGLFCNDVAVHHKSATEQGISLADADDLEHVARLRREVPGARERQCHIVFPGLCPRVVDVGGERGAATKTDYFMLPPSSGSAGSARAGRTLTLWAKAGRRNKGFYYILRRPSPPPPEVGDQEGRGRVRPAMNL
jgi:hypothetical protein